MGQTTEQIIAELKEQIIKALNLDEMTPEDMDATKPLFGSEGIGLDSIDALEIIVLLEKNYGIRLTNAAEGKKIFTSIENIAKYVSENRKK
jgi:Phosphopantetheine attachment site.